MQKELRSVKRIREAGQKMIAHADDADEDNGKIGQFSKVHLYISYNCGRPGCVCTCVCAYESLYFT